MAGQTVETLPCSGSHSGLMTVCERMFILAIAGLTIG